MGQITEEEAKILEHVHRYRLSTPEVLACRFLREGHNLDALIGSLQDKECLGPAYPLYDDKVYYQLTDRAEQEHFQADGSSRPFSRAGLARAYAVLAFCSLGPKPKERLTKPEFQHLFPALARARFPYPDYYVALDAVDAAPLGLMSIDSGGEAERQGRRLHMLVQRLSGLAGFSQLVTGGQLTLSVITSTVEKAATLAEGFRKRPLPTPPQLVIIPELVRLQDEQRP